MFNPIPGKPDDREPEKYDTASRIGRSAPPSFPDDPEIGDEVYTYTLERLLKGDKPAEIRKALIESGLTKQQTDRVVQGAIRFRKQYETYQATAGRRNGGEFIAIGLILWGAGIFMRFAGLSGGLISTLMLFSDLAALVLIIMGIVALVRRRRSSKS